MTTFSSHRSQNSSLDHQSTPFTQFVRSSPTSISPLVILKILCDTDHGRESSITFLEAGFRTYGYLLARLRGPRGQSQLRTARLLAVLSGLAIGRRVARIVGQLRARRSLIANESGLKWSLRITADVVQLVVNLFDDLHWLAVLGLHIPFHAPGTVITSICAILSAVTRFASSSLTKAELWHLGRRTRTMMLERERLVRDSHKAGVRVRMPPTDGWTNQWGELVDEEQNEAEHLVVKERKTVLKYCRRAIDRIWWTRLGIISDGLCSAYDLLEDGGVSLGVRVTVSLMSSCVSFREAYVETLKKTGSRYEYRSSSPS